MTPPPGFAITLVQGSGHGDVAMKRGPVHFLQDVRASLAAVAACDCTTPRDAQRGSLEGLVDASAPGAWCARSHEARRVVRRGARCGRGSALAPLSA